MDENTGVLLIGAVMLWVTLALTLGFLAATLATLGILLMLAGGVSYALKRRS